MLKNLRLWLEGHPHFNVEANWGPVVMEWVSSESFLFTFWDDCSNKFRE